MAKRRLGMEADFFFEAGPYSSEDLKVVRFEGEEALSELFHFQLDLAMVERSPDFEAILGKPAMLTIEGNEGTRYINGIVSKFEQASDPSRLTQYKAELVPKIWLLGLRRKSRIFQDLTVPKIIEQVLKDASIPASEYQFKLKASYADREYCVQYRESDLAFISRLMEEEGIYYWFEHSKNKAILIMADAKTLHTPIEGDSKLYFQSATGQQPDIEHIFKFLYAQAVRPGEVVLRDFDFKKPKLDLTANKTADINVALQIYDYPGEYVAPAEGKSLSEIRLQEQQTPRKVGDGKSNCRRLVPGYKFNMLEHPRSDLNREYLLIRVGHFGVQLQSLKEGGDAAAPNEYRAGFSCIPSDVQYRAARVTPRPAIAGSQTAIVTGPGGEEIYPDEHGRVKVQFHWDREGKRNEKSSCWIRVSQTWAGPSWGAVIIPRIGQEVIVQFLEGDPDRPIIVGTVYNGDNRVPYGLPGEKTKSTLKSNTSLGGGGYNEFRFEDNKGKEEIFLHGQKDWNIVIVNDKTQRIGHDESLDVGHDRSKHVVHDQLEKIDNNKTIIVGVDHTESIGNNKSLTVGANHTESIVANMSLMVGSNKTETVALVSAETVGAAKALTVGAAYQVTVGAAMNETVGGARMEEVGGYKMEAVGGNSTEGVGAKKEVTVGGDYSVSVAKNLSFAVKAKGTVSVDGDLDIGTSKKLTVKAKEDILIESDKQIVLKSGSAEITLKKNGDIEIKGKAINIKGSSDVKIKGSKVGIN